MHPKNLKVKKVINLFGGPGIGKTTIASGLFYFLKTQGKSVELVPEYAKSLVHEERHNILEHDQLYVFTKQHRRLSNVSAYYDYIVMDSPIILSLVYFKKNKMIYDYDLFEQLAVDTFNKYPNINILIKRNGYHFSLDEGRVENNIDAVKNMDLMIQNKLINLKIPFFSIKNDNKITENICQKLEVPHV